MYECIAKCAAEVVSKLVVYSIVYAKNDDFFVQLPANKSVTVVNYLQDCNFFRRNKYQDLYLVQSGDLGFIDDFFKMAQVTKSWAASTKTVVVYYGASSLVALLEIVWSYSLANLLILTGNCTLYTYYPITEEKCRAVKPVLLGSEYLPGLKLFGESSTDKFAGCPLRVAFYEEAPWQFKWTNADNPKGIFPKMHMAIQKALDCNSTIFDNYTSPLKLPNGSYTGVYKGMQENLLDYRLGASASLEIMEDFEFIPVYITEDFYYLVPRATNNEVWTNLVNIFLPEMWLAIVATYLVFAIACFFLKFNEGSIFCNINYCILIEWKIMFTVNSRLPKSPNFKLLFILWTFTTWLLTSSFQCFMSTTLFIPQHDQEIDSVEELLKSKMAYGGSYLVRDAYIAMDTQISRQLAENLVFCTFDMSCVDRTVNKRDFATVKNQHKFMYFWKNYLDANGVPKFFWFATEIRLMQGIFTRKGLIYNRRLRELTLRFFQSGLLQVWDKYLIFRPFVIPKTHQERITLEHLFVAFMLLVFGLCVSTVFFFVEVYRDKV